MPPSPDQPDLQRLDYLQQMLRELREIAELERFNYGWSILHCLPAGRAEPGSDANGSR